MERRHSLTVTWGDEAAGLVINGGRVLDVFTGGLLEADAAIAGGFVAALGKGREGGGWTLTARISCRDGSTRISTR